jgi:type IV pilus assembly protein PilB
MRISDKTLEELLIRSGVATAKQIVALQEESARSKRPLQELALQHELIDEKSLVKAFAEYTQVPYVELDVSKIPTDVLEKIPERVARQYNAVVFQVDDNGVYHLAIEDPDDVIAINFIQKELGTNTKIYITTRENILAALELYRGDVNKELNEVIDIQRVDEGDSEIIAERDVAEDSPIAQTVNLLLEYAIRSHASDIHIEPREEFVQVRYRIDGVLKEVNRLPRNVLSSLISRVKILSNLKIDERRVPQDGRFKISVGGKRYALRVSTLPISDGEKVVMRILNESSQAVTLDTLGFWGQSLARLNSAMVEPNGMILITGPTGSGKSTTLFSVLTILNTENVNISTVEDPVEYKIPGVNQTQVNPKAGMTFANGLRSLLRQDPNIIMIGEIRDSETADLSIQAALTGHLVFSTLHTNNAATSLPRLLDMGIEPFLIASTVRATIGQRLVRRLRPETRQSYTPTPEENTAVLSMFGGLSASQIHELEKAAMTAGVGGSTPLSTTPNGIATLWKADPNDDEDGASDGYRGRLGIYEVLTNGPNIEKLIISNATSDQIHRQAINEGMLTMKIDGLIKALRGETTIEEVARVTKE